MSGDQHFRVERRPPAPLVARLPSAIDDTVTMALDRSAIVLSMMCLLHCLALPMVFAAMPALTAIVPDQPWLHPAILALAAPLAGVALWRGWRRHRDRRPAAIGFGGVALLAAGVFATAAAGETLLTVSGGLLLAIAHLINWRSAHRLRHRAGKL